MVNFGARNRKGSGWGCPDLTDSGFGIKTRRSPHENTECEAGSREGELPLIALSFCALPESSAELAINLLSKNRGQRSAFESELRRPCGQSAPVLSRIFVSAQCNPSFSTLAWICGGEV